MTRLTVTAIPEPSMTVDSIRLLIRDLGIFDTSADLSGLPDRITMVTDERRIYEVMNIISDADLTVGDISADGHRSFKEIFSKSLPIDAELTSVYMTMCQEGRI